MNKTPFPFSALVISLYCYFGWTKTTAFTCPTLLFSSRTASLPSSYRDDVHVQHRPFFQSTETSLPATTTLHASAKQLVSKTQTSIFKGRLTAFVSKFLISPNRAWQIGQTLLAALSKNWLEILTITVVYYAAMPLACRLYAAEHPDWIRTGDASSTSSSSSQEDSSDGNKKMNKLFEQKFKLSKTRRIARGIQEVAQLGGILFGVEMGLLFLKELGFQFVSKYPVNAWAISTIASLWGAINLSEFKDFALTKGGRMELSKSAGRKLISRILDIAIFGGTGILILDFLSVQMGFALRSILGLSSVGTLVFSLASKELVSEFLASLAIQGTNMYTEGEKIMLQDGTLGTVQKLGWLNTHLRRSDELVVRIPNTQISGKRVANISRSNLSAVKEALAISHDEVDKLPQLMQDIKQEVRDSCPSLVTDGSRGFQVFFTEYKESSLTVSISAYFRVKPYTEAYHSVKQDVLLAIRRATKKNDVKFSYVNFQNAVSVIPLD